jgi:molecular chaperone DnaK
MVKDAEVNAAEDHKKVELVQARNQADSTVHSVRKSLTEHGEKLDAAEKSTIESALKDVEEAIKGDDKAAIDKKVELLMTASQKLGEKMYASQAEEAAKAGPAGAGPTGAGAGASTAGASAGADSKPSAAADDNVVDAEFKEVKK